MPVLNATLTEEDVSLSTQLYYVLVMLCSGPALNKCYNAGVTEGFESWRQFVLQWEPKLASRFVGLLMQLLTFQFEGDLSHKISQFDRLVAAYETQAKKKVDDDIKVGVAIIGMRDAKVKEHLVRNAARLSTWASMSAEVIEISHTQEYLNSTPAPMQLGALPEKKAKGEAKAQKPSGSPGDKDKECFYCKKKGHVKADCRARQRDLAAAEGRGGGKNSKRQLAAAPTSEQPQATQQAPVQQQTLQQPQQVYMAPTMPMVQYPGGQTGPYPVSAMTIAPAPDQGFLLAMPLCASADAGSSARALETAESTLQLTRVAPLAAESVAGEKNTASTELSADAGSSARAGACSADVGSSARRHDADAGSSDRADDADAGSPARVRKHSAGADAGSSARACPRGAATSRTCSTSSAAGRRPLSALTRVAPLARTPAGSADAGSSARAPAHTLAGERGYA